MAAANTINGSGVALYAKIQEALEVVYSPASTNEARKDAQIYLEEIKNHDEAPSHGFHLASDKTQSPIVRHYALSLLEYAIKHKWAQYDSTQATALRNWVVQLAPDVSPQDPAYLRKKIALLWVEVAKRCWAADWMDMDALLVQLWNVEDSYAHKELVLSILEMLSDDIFGTGTDLVVEVREGVLSKAAVEIFTQDRVLLQYYPNRIAGPEVRYGEEGWLCRISEFLNHKLTEDLLADNDLRACVVRAIAVLYAMMPWVMFPAISNAGTLEVLLRGLRANHADVYTACIEALHVLYARSGFSDADFIDLVLIMYDPEYVARLDHIYSTTTVDPSDIDEPKYQLQKRLSEIASNLGLYLGRRFDSIPHLCRMVPRPDINPHPFLHLLLKIAQSESLVVSIPVLMAWSRFLDLDSIASSILEMPSLIGPLLELCSDRLIQYECMPEDTDDNTFLFLMEDTDTIPERHTFLGNYRRFCTSIIEKLVQLKVSDAMQHILGKADNILDHLYDNLPGFDMAHYSKTSQAVLRVDNQATVVESALKGFNSWRAKHREHKDQHDHQVESLQADLEAWCNQLMMKNFADPLIKKRIIQLLVVFSIVALDKKPAFVLKVLEHVLMNWPGTEPVHKMYTEAVKDLQAESMNELQRLAATMPDHLLDYCDQLAAKLNEMTNSGILDEKRQITFQTVLFTIVHRTTRLDESTKIQRLQEFIDPVKRQWQDANLQRALSSHANFWEMMGLDKAQDYLRRKGVHEIRDWGSVQLDAEGQSLQAELEQRQTFLPLRPTKAFLSASVEKMGKSSNPYQVSCALWQDGFPTILTQLLQFLTYAHGSHCPDNWTGLPVEMRIIVNRVLTDRFWQAGISEGTKDDFYARVLEKKNTLEGLASAIRGSIRFVRESCYAILYCMTRLDMQFYGFSELPSPLAQALLSDAFSLSAHQLINLLSLVRYLVDNCPVPLREQFLPPILSAAIGQIDARVTDEWQQLEQQQGVIANGVALAEEMKSESILRQLTYAAVMMVADFLDPSKTNKSSEDPASADLEEYPTLRQFCLMHSSVVEPLLVFCTHVLRIRDTKSLSTMLKVFRSLIPEFSRWGGTEAKVDEVPAGIASAIREYISSDVVKACITSIHDGYFVDLQKDLAGFIALIVVTYGGMSSTARDVLVSLPNIKAEDVDRGIQQMMRKETSQRAQRAVILQLLSDIKGVSVSEMGKVDKSIGLPTVPSSSSSSRRPLRSKMAQEFMMTPSGEGAGMTSRRQAGGPSNGSGAADGTDALEGVASLFDS
ncbi:armadillo-type protein [Xylariomycetidae sp. FL2044]|nr:armadillo-type protein [Xylariomycetidae sp. FL2044]